MKLTHAQELAEELMNRHRLSSEWSFAFDHSKVRFGTCHYGKKRITLSRHLVRLNAAEEVRDTILHEIAHALAPRGAGHGPIWRALAIAIGCKGQRCYGREVLRPTPKYRGTCPTCGTVIHRHRRTSIACGKCAPAFDPKHKFIWSAATPDDGGHDAPSLELDPNAAATAPARQQCSVLK